MGGSIDVTSEIGKGSKFWFSIPMPVAPPRLESSAEMPLRSIAEAVASLRGRRVLIVDDIEVNRRIVHEEISSWGMRNGSYATGDEALAAVRAAHLSGDPYDVVIADYQMPGMDGATLAAAVKAEPGSSGLVFILLTSIGHWRELRNLEGASVDACLVKPVRQKKLMDTLASACAKKAQPRIDRAMGDSSQVSRSLAEEGRHLAHSGNRSAVRALLVEDNTVNQRVGLMILGKMGIRADVASDGREGVEMLKVLPYDIVFMDCQMPVMNGYEAVREVRKLASPNQHVPIVAITADAMQGNRERCLDAGMDDFIAKPVRREDFARALKRWLPKDREIGVTDAVAMVGPQLQ